MNNSWAISVKVIAVISAIVLLDIVVTAHSLYLKSARIQLLSLLTMVMALLTTWGHLYRQHKQIQQLEDRALSSRILNSSIAMVFSVNLCVLGGLGMLMH